MKRRGHHTVVIDFPYPVKLARVKTAHGNYASKMPYKVMTLEQIRNFDIDQFAAPDCDLFIWTFQSRLRFTLDLFERWGFKYKLLFTWHKNTGINNDGIHYNSEFVAYGYRGKPGIIYKGKNISTAFNAKRSIHSQKPREFYEMIRPKTTGPRIDIFARRRHPGFDAWGDQVEQA